MTLRRGAAPVLLGSVFLIAICGLIYELLFATLSSYLLGSSVTQFSLVIGFYLTAMGIGSFLSRFVTRELLRTFLLVEILVGVAGGLSALLLFFVYAALQSYLPWLVGASLLVGALVGLEIPLLIRILRGQASLRTALGNVLALDYLGALVASLLFPLLLVPYLGLVRTSFLFGLVNVAVGLVGAQLFRQQIRGAGVLRWGGVVAALAMLAGLISAGRTTSLLEDALYDDPVVFAKSTKYQRLVVTHWRGDLRLFIDGNIQFSSIDEFRYHEALVHPAMSLIGCPKRQAGGPLGGEASAGLQVLVLGGGDGLAARELLKYGCLRRVDLVDLDPEMTRLFSKMPLLLELNQRSLLDRRVQVHNEDAQKFLEQRATTYDLILIDLPDPNNEGLGRLYTRSFYRLVAQHLRPDGVVVTQATSPFFAPEAFWCIVNTMASADLGSQRLRAGEGSKSPSTSAAGRRRLRVRPYHASVPSFGEWGFVLGSFRDLSAAPLRLQVPTRYLTQQLLPSLFVFPADLQPRSTPINRLDNQVLVRLYDKGFRRFNR